MIEQQGRVCGTQGGTARVLLGGQSGCPACDEGKGCGAGIFGRLLNRGPVELDFKHAGDLQAGQAVTVVMPEGQYLGLVARLYGLPLMVGLLAAVGGFQLAVQAGWDGLLLDVTTGISGLLGGWFMLRHARRQLPRVLGGLSLEIIASSGASTGCPGIGTVRPGSD